ncbi:MAG: nucleotidyl transferase AbiEii/AbiGii toxin family protein [Gammaproteobacteria bacterium]|nr:nucleotidyl transferase AbiEii/AbiGii toxin family protein [Gammaproteobacteria bacterium]
MDLSAKQYVELFHLMFLRQFSGHIAANLYAIKGGCNLRFFFQSIRYSEDLDLDIQIIQKQTLEHKVNKILTSSSLLKLLQNHGITKIIANPSKQTPTTQRWKIQLYIDRLKMPLATKIEFSRRHDKFQSELGDINIQICQRYSLPPSRLSHYKLCEAVAQKILALAHRSLTQARDIFDLYHLLHIATQPKISLEKNSLEKAEVALSSISFGDYKSQVVTFLEPAHQQMFDNKDYWKTITNKVLHYLRELKK